jgi:hypothetical protein
VCSQDASIGAMVGQTLQCQCEHAAVWCVPSASGVSRNLGGGGGGFQQIQLGTVGREELGVGAVAP